MGMAFANRFAKEPIGIVQLQEPVYSEYPPVIHPALKAVYLRYCTGGRDLKESVGAITFLMALDVLRPRP
jgi:hypothetical protein